MRDDVTATLQADLATARLRHQDAQRRLRETEDALTAAQAAYDAAKKAGRDAADAVRAAEADLRRANG